MTRFSFMCANHDCDCHKTGMGIAYHTEDIRKAEQHSRENNSPMWIAEDTEERI